VAFKLLVLDIDGTLLGRDGSISPENRQALARASELGILVSLSTARTLEASRGVIDQLELHGCHIFFDGALVKDPAQDEEVCVRALEPELLKEVIAFARSAGVYLELHSTSRFFVERDHWSIPIRRELFGLEPTITSFDGLWHQERILKVVSVLKSAEEIARARLVLDSFRDYFHFSWAMTPAYPGVHFLNLVDPAVSKGRALGVLASHLSVSLAEVAVAGDAANDVSLFKRAGLSIAMGNAPDEVKAQADYVTLDVDRGGLAVALRKLVLEGV